MFHSQKYTIKAVAPTCSHHYAMPHKPESPARSPDMDPHIWSQLPVEILDLVLSFVPLKKFLNLRSTCKHFRSLMFSPSFMSKHTSSGSPFSSFLLLSHPQFHRCYSLYDYVLGTWRNLSLPSLIPNSAVNTITQSCTLLSSSHGLFCFSIPRSSSLVVCNFLANSSRIVEFPIYPFSFESLTFVSTPSGYRIFVLCFKFSSNSAFMYDSRFHSWLSFDDLDPIPRIDCHQEGVLFKGSLYFTTPEPFAVVSVGLETRKWKRVGGELPGDLTFVRLASDGAEKLYLIGGIGRNGISKNMKMWELRGGSNWIEVESLPDMICKKLMSVCYHNYEQVNCFWHEGMICICCNTWPEILYYKVSRKTWHWLPKSPSLPHKWSCGFRWFSFVPDLSAPV